MRVIAATTFGVLPQMLLAASAVLVRRDLGLSLSQLGAIFSATFTALAAGALVASRLPPVDPTRLVRTGTAGTTLALFGIGAWTHSFVTLVAPMLLVGLSAGLVNFGCNLLITSQVPPARQGWVFGLKVGAVPAATSIAGFLVPVAVLDVGWRAVFVGTAVGGLALVVISRGGPGPGVAALTTPAAGTPSARIPGRRSALMLLGFALGLGIVASAMAPLYLAETVVGAGYSSAVSGWVLGAASFGSVVMRLTAGARADRRGTEHVRAVVRMLLLGGLGFVAVAFCGMHWSLLVIGAAIALGPGWGWQGVLLLAATRAFAHDPRAGGRFITSIAAVSALVAPYYFALAVEVSSLDVAWLVSAVLMALTATILIAARRRLLATRPL